MGKPLAGLVVRLGLNTIGSRAGLWTDLHGVLNMLHRTVDGYFEFVTGYFGNSLEPRPGEPVRDVPYCPMVRQLVRVSV